MRWFIISMGVFGAALLYGDSTITPAISVLSSVEGLEVATPFFKPYILPITIVILILLFSFQRQGTRSVGSVFGVVMLLWFALLAVVALLVFGGEVIRGFSIAMVWGIFVGAYSSVFVAVPILVYFNLRPDQPPPGSEPAAAREAA